MVQTINGLLSKLGIKIKKYPEPDLARRLKIMQRAGIGLLFDVGANTGLYGKEMRALGYRGKIVSFEPLREAFAQLEKRAGGDAGWTVHNYALGDADGASVINVSANSESSSLSGMLDGHIESAPESRYIATQEIEVKRLDSLAAAYFGDDTPKMLKLDVQGYEQKVLEGAATVLNQCAIVQLEMSLTPLYENDIGYLAMIAYMQERGFALMSLEDVYSDEKTGRLMQVDGVFVNDEL